MPDLHMISRDIAATSHSQPLVTDRASSQESQGNGDGASSSDLIEKELRSLDPHPLSQEVISPPGKQRLGRDSSDSEGDFYNGIEGGEHLLASSRGPNGAGHPVTSSFRNVTSPAPANHLNVRISGNGA